MLRPALSLAAVAVRVPLWLTTHAASPAARRHERAAYARIARGLGLRIAVEGTIRSGGTLFLANHISFADIPVLGSVLDATFVSKREVADWPVVGPMARRVGTLFVDRARRSDAHAQNQGIRERLRAGDDIVLFPEGTTSDGTALLPFRATLLAAADAASRVQPVALAYRAADGGPLTPARLKAIAWTGGNSLLSCARAFHIAPTLASLHFLDPIDPDLGRKALAIAAREAIAGVYVP